MGALKCPGALHDAYEKMVSPACLTHVWDEIAYEYNIIVAESLRPILRALPRAERRYRLRKKATLLIKDGATVLEFPATFHTKSRLGFWKSRVFPWLERRAGRDMRPSAIPVNLGGMRASGLFGAELVEQINDPPDGGKRQTILKECIRLGAN